MRYFALIVLFLITSLDLRAQAPVLVVNRVDKYTKELIKQTSMYSINDASGTTKLYVSALSKDEYCYLQFNVNAAVTIKKGTTITLMLDNGQALNLKSDNDIISLSDTDVNKRMFVCSLTDKDVKTLLARLVTSIKIPTSNKGIVNVDLAKDRTVIKTSMALVVPKTPAK